MFEYMVFGVAVTGLNWALRYQAMAKTAKAVLAMRLAAGMSRRAALAWAVLVDVPLVTAIWPLQVPKIAVAALDGITGRGTP